MVWVDVYEQPFAVLASSNVDRFFDTCPRYLEALMALPDARGEKGALLTFPWEVPELFARDTRLVELLRAGNSASIMKTTGMTPQWTSRVLATAKGA